MSLSTKHQQETTCIPPVIGHAMSRLVILSVVTAEIARRTNKLGGWVADSEQRERSTLRLLVQKAFGELISFSSLFGFFLSFVIHEKMRENRIKYFAQAMEAAQEETTKEVNDLTQSSYSERDSKEKKRKREAGERVMDKYNMHGPPRGIIGPVPFSQGFGFWDTQYKKPDFRASVRQSFLNELNFLICDVAGFASSRGWTGTYTPKRICMSLLAECGEISANLEWREETDVVSSLPREVKVDIARETADVAIYLLHLARQLEMRAGDFNRVW